MSMTSILGCSYKGRVIIHREIFKYPYVFTMYIIFMWHFNKNTIYSVILHSNNGMFHMLTCSDDGTVWSLIMPVLHFLNRSHNSLAMPVFICRVLAIIVQSNKTNVSYVSDHGWPLPCPSSTCIQEIRGPESRASQSAGGGAWGINLKLW